MFILGGCLDSPDDEQFWRYTPADTKTSTSRGRRSVGGGMGKGKVVLNIYMVEKVLDESLIYLFEIIRSISF